MIIIIIIIIRVFPKATRYSTNTYPICNSPDFRDGHGEALLRYRNRAKLTVLMCKQKPYPIAKILGGSLLGEH